MDLRSPALSPRLLMIVSLCICGLVPAASTCFGQDSGAVHYEGTLRIDPETQSATVDVTLTAPFEMGRIDLPAAASGREGEVRNGIAWVTLESESFPYRAQHTVRVDHPLEEVGESSARSFSSTPGIIEERGAVLNLGSGWLPQVPGAQVTFDLQVEIPEAWRLVMTGDRVRGEAKEGFVTVHATCASPLDDIHLVAGPFHLFEKPLGNVTARAYLRAPDEALATRYLDATGQYVEMYRGLIGTYPYSEFALVENFWETGFGMPGFTLLGPQVIRLPFILHSSYPHEILHCWWGNGVFVDVEQGNWCEGLTAYLADHLIQETRGRGADYRKGILEKYRAFVRDGRDFPLTEFRSRHSGATEAVGYGKAAMIFHMVRRGIGDDKFRIALGRFYRKHKGKKASWRDFADAVSGAADVDAWAFIEPWVTRAGAPEIYFVQQPDGVYVHTRGEAQFPVYVPVVVTYADGSVSERNYELAATPPMVELDPDREWIRIDLDPNYDVFRLLHSDESPATLAQAFGDSKTTIVVPHVDQGFEAAEWLVLAEAWKAEGVDVVTAGSLSHAHSPKRTNAKRNELFSKGSVWILGSLNDLAVSVGLEINSLSDGFEKAENTVSFLGEEQSLDGKSVVVMGRSWHDTEGNHAVGWIFTDTPTAIPGLARKLPHYGKYSYLTFEGDEPTIHTKGRWPVSAPSVVQFAPGQEDAERGEVGERTALAEPAPVVDEKALVEHVRVLASREMAGRAPGTPGGEKARRYIESQYAEIGLAPLGDDGFVHATETDGTTVDNVVGQIVGKNPDKVVVLCAHFDHLGEQTFDAGNGIGTGAIYYGADDNASGVSVMLEVARRFAKGAKPERSIWFIAFDGEERGRLGSRGFLASLESKTLAKELGDVDILTAVNLDAVGRSTGDPFILFGCETADEWKHVAMGVGFTTGIDVKQARVDPRASDHTSFIDAGIPAVHLSSGPHDDYHKTSDTADKVVAASLVRAAVWTTETLGYLANRLEPFQVTIPEKPVEAPKPKGDRVSFGLLPDYATDAEGLGVTSVTEGGPAARAGIVAGDLIVEISGEPIGDIHDYTDALRSIEPGSAVAVVVLRDGERVAVMVELAQ